MLAFYKSFSFSKGTIVLFLSTIIFGFGAKAQVNVTAMTFYNYNPGTGNQLAFNNAYINTTTPIFSVSGDYSPGSFNAIKIDISTSSVFSSVNFSQTFTGVFAPGSQYDLTFSSIGLVDSTTYYVRAFGSGDGGTNWGAASAGAWSFIYRAWANPVEWKQQSQAQFNTWTSPANVSANASSVTMTSAPTNLITDPCLSTGSGWSADISHSHGGQMQYNNNSPDWPATGTCSRKGKMSVNGSSFTYSAGDYVIVQQLVDLTNVNQISYDFAGVLLAGYGLFNTPIPANTWEYDLFLGGTQNNLDGTKVVSFTRPTNDLAGGYNENIPSPNIIASTSGFTGNTWVKFALKALAGGSLKDLTANGEVAYYIDNVKAIANGTGVFRSPPISLASFINAAHWGALNWYQALNGGSISFKIQYSGDGIAWLDAAGLTNITLTGDGAKTYDISSVGDSAQIRIVGTLNYGTASPVLSYYDVSPVLCASPPPAPEITVVNSCANSVLSTTATGSLRWTTGETTSSITVTTAGIYRLTTTTGPGCKSQPGTGIAAPKSTPSAPSVLIVNNCNASSTLSTTASGGLLWSTSETTTSITVSTAGTYSVTLTINGCTSAPGTGIPVLAGCPLTFNYTLFLQDYYVSSSGTMSPLRHLLGSPGASSTDVDTLTIELHNSAWPYALATAFNGLMLRSNGSVTFTATVNYGSYYLVVKHRNSLETWSSAPVLIDATHHSYNFTTGASKAFGNNLVNLGGAYGIYSGDIDQNGSINGLDKAAFRNRIKASFISGTYDVNDITGDGMVDEDDYRTLSNNIRLFITVRHP